jgi:hypothetical protein
MVIGMWSVTGLSGVALGVLSWYLLRQETQIGEQVYSREVNPFRSPWGLPRPWVQPLRALTLELTTCVLILALPHANWVSLGGSLVLLFPSTWG